MQPKTYIFFRITPPTQSLTSWAREYEEIFGFEWALDHTIQEGKVIAWPSEDSDVEILKEYLDEEEIEYSTFEIMDLDKFLGV